jgi:hypothetical protein
MCVLNEGDKGEVMKLEGKEKSKWRPLPMSTIEFNKMATKKLHITSA